jgi:glycosyltransferase involved in cell wall biosynthesis
VAARSAELRRRWSLYRSGGRWELDRQLWTYLPLAPFSPHRYPLLRSRGVHRHWHRWTYPSVPQRARQAGFGQVDWLYIDSISQHFWLDAIDYGKSVLRVTDYSPHFAKYTPAARELEEEMARRVDLVVYPSPELKEYVAGLGPKRSLYLPNGVELEHFHAAQPMPPEYRDVDGPIAVYVGVILEWFHFAWLREAARRLPHLTFVLIGPDRLARAELSGLANVRLLGCRDYQAMPAYLQHADIGLMPFNRDCQPATVESLNPLKLYQYLASGLPVVSSEWTALRQLSAPVRMCRSGQEFVATLAGTVADPGDAAVYREFAAHHSWSHRLQSLNEQLGQIA